MEPRLDRAEPRRCNRRVNVQGSADIPRPREAVFDRLLDPGFFERCIPGCESIEEIAPGRYETLVKTTVGPIRGSFKGTATLSDVVRPESCTLTVEGKSSVGHVRSVASVRLEETASGTRVHYTGHAKISGLLGRMGGRLLEPAAEKVAGEFFERLTRELGGDSSTGQKSPAG